MTREIILDTETTGLDPFSGHRVIEIGALEMINKVLTGRKFHYYINPERNVPDEAYRIHGISTDFLGDKPKFKEISAEFLEFIEDGKLVIHNAPFDLKFLNHELSLLNLSSLNLSDAIDTLIIARKTFPGARVNLDALCKRFKVDNTSRTFHGALMDAFLLAEVYVELSGGRQTSFMINSENKELSTGLLSSSGAVVGNGIVVLSTDDENKKHQEFLRKAFG